MLDVTAADAAPADAAAGLSATGGGTAREGAGDGAARSCTGAASSWASFATCRTWAASPEKLVPSHASATSIDASSSGVVAGQAENVRVELFPTLARRVGVGAEGRPDTTDLVGRDGRADGIAADEHAGLHEVAEHGLPHDTCVVRIVDGLGREGAEVQHHVPVGLEGEAEPAL